MKFTLPYGKKVLILGIALLVAGFSIIGLLYARMLFVGPEAVYGETLDMTTSDSYLSPKFRAESGYWLNLDINSNASSTIHVVGQTVGEIFRVDGTSYMYKVQITLGDVYQVQVENKANYYYWFSYIRVNNHVSGNFDLKRAPYNFFEILPAGFVLIAIGLLIIPSVAYLEHRTRQEAKLLYQCQRCGKTVRIGMETCPYCKLDLTKYWITCKYCGKFYDSHLEKCPKCGADTR